MRKLFLLLSVLLFCTAPKTWAFDAELTACHNIAGALRSYNCIQTNNTDTKNCKSDMTAANSKGAAAACWKLVNNWYPNTDGSGLAKCEAKAAQLFADAGGTAMRTDSPIYKSLMEAFKDVDSRGGACGVNYQNAKDAYDAAQKAKAPVQPVKPAAVTSACVHPKYACSPGWKCKDIMGNWDAKAAILGSGMPCTKDQAQALANSGSDKDCCALVNEMDSRAKDALAAKTKDFIKAADAAKGTISQLPGSIQATFKDPGGPNKSFWTVWNKCYGKCKAPSSQEDIATYCGNSSSNPGGLQGLTNVITNYIQNSGIPNCKSVTDPKSGDFAAYCKMDLTGFPIPK